MAVPPCLQRELSPGTKNSLRGIEGRQGVANVISNLKQVDQAGQSVAMRIRP
jgi:hypothetical protein